MKKILLLSVSAGAGHVRAAEALMKTAETNFHESIETHHIDVMTLVPKLFRKLYAENFIHVVKHHPALWGYMYDKTDKESSHSLLSKMKQAIEKLNTTELFTEIELFNPDAIICTHFLPAELLSKALTKGKIDIPLYVQVTDFDVHHFWIHPHITGYFCASEEIAYRMKSRGVPQESIHTTGIPISPAFTQNFDKVHLAEKYGLSTDKQTVLLMSGGAGVGDLQSLAEAVLQSHDSCQLIALTGRNEELFTQCEQLAKQYNNRLLPLGYTKTIEELMAISDIAISKPGGLTTSECLAMCLPMIIISPIPGQEERNADYILENGAGLKAHDTAGLIYRLQKILANFSKLKSLKQHCKNIATPTAASEVLQKVNGYLS